MTVLKVTTHDTTLEALLTGKARLASYRDWPSVNVLELRDPFQDALPCWHPDSFIHVTISYYNLD